MEKTIFALASGGLPSGVGVIRVSGPNVDVVCSRLLRKNLSPRVASLQSVFHPESGIVLDEVIALYFPAPNSFTGEDVLELQGHGGVASIAALLDGLAAVDGCRPAEAGEFSRRAFENGRMDLTELEGLSDLISAQTESQRVLAFEQAGGSLRSLYDGWRSDLIRCRALIEAELDFSDEDDVPDSVSDQVWTEVSALHTSVLQHLENGERGEIVRSGFRIALLGAPNAGKSSLLNHLAKRDVAIVTPQAGTTRDVIEVSLDIDGQLVIVSDTAGLRDAVDVVEVEGIRRARSAALSADLVLWLQASEDDLPPKDLVTDFEVHVLKTMADLRGLDVGPSIIHTMHAEGTAPFLSWLRSELGQRLNRSESPLFSRLRHRLVLNDLASCLSDVSTSSPIELRSEHLRRASDLLGRLTGRVDVEDLLDVIFSEFCVGK